MKSVSSYPIFSSASPSHRADLRVAAFRAGLLAASSAAALLVGAHSANAGPGPGQVVLSTTPSVSNNASITSIQILGPNGTVQGAVTNTGTIAGVTNGNTAFGIRLVGAGSVGGGISNTGAITVTQNPANGQLGAVGILIFPNNNGITPGTVSGGISNGGTISASATNSALGIEVAGGATINGSISNTQTITATAMNGSPCEPRRG